MESTERNRVYYDHIVFTWLNSNPDSNDIDCLLRGESQTNLRSLKSLVRRPRLELGSITFVNDQGVNSTLSDDQARELKGVISFLNHNQNWYGPTITAGHFDITTTTRDDFLSFIEDHDDLENNPVLPDNDIMIKAYEMRMRVHDNNNNNNSNSNNNRTRSNSPRSSRSTSPTVRRVTNHLLVQFLKEKRPLTDYSMPLEDIMQWPEWDRQLDALAHAHMVWKRYLSTSTLRHQDQMRRRYGRRCRFICTTYSSSLSRRQKVYVSSRNIRPIGTHRPYTRSCVTTTLARHRRWQLPTSIRWRIAL